MCVKKSEAKFESLRLLYLFEKGRKFSIDRVDAIRVEKKFESLYVGVFVKKGGNFWKFSIDVIYLYKK